MYRVNTLEDTTDLIHIAPVDLRNAKLGVVAI
jgi:hypothetical protein